MSDSDVRPATDGHERITLNDGRHLPLVGFGAQYGFADDGNLRGDHGLAHEYVASALRAGHRMVDTARCYQTEESVLRGIADAGLDRSDVFVISKAWPGVDHDPGVDSSREAIAESARNLGGYVDLYLVHHPADGWQDLWRALEDARDEGLVRSIGVSNFRREHLEELDRIARIPPAVDEIHLHPFVYEDQADTLAACSERDVAVIGFPRTPWSMGRGGPVDQVAEKHGRTRAQVMLRWSLEHGHATIPLSTNPEHLSQNLAITDFRLDPTDMNLLDKLSLPRSLHFHLDHATADYIGGWACAAEGIDEIRVLIGGEDRGSATLGLPRPDVEAVHPAVPNSATSGFGFRIPLDAIPQGTATVALQIRLGDGKLHVADVAELPGQLLERTPSTDPLPARAPFPTEVLELLRDLRGADFPAHDDWSEDEVVSAVDDLVLLVERGSKRVEGIYRYLRFLVAVARHSEFVARHFPRFNARVAVDDKDAISVASTPEEMVSIANHLYVLKSRGFTGQLAEFGCFKGYSTSCLSYACRELGIGMDVYDSFEGLPSSENTYYTKGEFAGSMDEVRRNVGELGAIEVVEFHKGFYSDTLATAKVEPLCIWMDVDLYSSSKDVMTILPKLPKESCVFSHESEPSDFADGTIAPTVLEDSPLVPIAEAFRARGGELRGRFLCGDTGAFWEHGVSIPVLPFDQLRRLLEL